VSVRLVLVVDDNPAIRKIVCEFFTREGDFEVCGQAENGREAIEKAQLLQPALIVTDISMPLMDGLEETRILKKLMPSVPVIIFSAHIDPFVEKKAIAAGASAVVSKYDAVTTLIGKARELLDQIAAQLLHFPIWESQSIPLQNPESFAGICDGQAFGLVGRVFCILG
jgi:DNA-binding NarL/FixJ family response regulator